MNVGAFVARARRVLRTTDTVYAAQMAHLADPKDHWPQAAAEAVQMARDHVAKRDAADTDDLRAAHAAVVERALKSAEAHRTGRHAQAEAAMTDAKYHAGLAAKMMPSRYQISWRDDGLHLDAGDQPVAVLKHENEVKGAIESYERDVAAAAAATAKAAEHTDLIKEAADAKTALLHGRAAEAYHAAAEHFRARRSLQGEMALERAENAASDSRSLGNPIPADVIVPLDESGAYHHTAPVPNATAAGDAMSTAEAQKPITSNLDAARRTADSPKFDESAHARDPHGQWAASGAHGSTAKVGERVTVNPRINAPHGRDGVVYQRSESGVLQNRSNGAFVIVKHQGGGEASYHESDLRVPARKGERVRKYPSYTTAQLKEFSASSTGKDKDELDEEIAARESGASTTKVTPQIGPATKGATPFAMKSGDAGKFDESKHPRANNGQFGAGSGKGHWDHAAHHSEKADSHAEAAKRAGISDTAKSAHLEAEVAHNNAMKLHDEAHGGAANSGAAHAASLTAHQASRAASIAAKPISAEVVHPEASYHRRKERAHEAAAERAKEAGNHAEHNVHREARFAHAEAAEDFEVGNTQRGAERATNAERLSAATKGIKPHGPTSNMDAKRQAKTQQEDGPHGKMEAAPALRGWEAKFTHNGGSTARTGFATPEEAMAQARKWHDEEGPTYTKLAEQLARRKAIKSGDSGFEEGKHPRDHGKFSSKPGAGAGHREMAEHHHAQAQAHADQEDRLRAAGNHNAANEHAQAYAAHGYANAAHMHAHANKGQGVAEAHKESEKAHAASAKAHEAEGAAHGEDAEKAKSDMQAALDRKAQDHETHAERHRQMAREHNAEAEKHEGPMRSAHTEAAKEHIKAAKARDTAAKNPSVYEFSVKGRNASDRAHANAQKWVKGGEAEKARREASVKPSFEDVMADPVGRRKVEGIEDTLASMKGRGGDKELKSVLKHQIEELQKSHGYTHHAIDRT